MSEMSLQEVIVCSADELDDKGCREFSIGDGDWPLRGFVVREGGDVFAYQNICMHVGHPLNWKPDSFLTKDGSRIMCASHGALYDIASGECVAGPCPGKFLKKVEIEIRDGIIVAKGKPLR